MRKLLKTPSFHKFIIHSDNARKLLAKSADIVSTTIKTSLGPAVR